MPELPEVETVCAGLRPNIINKKISSVTLRRSGLRYPFPQGLTALKGHQVTKVWRRSKLAIFDFSNGQSTILHLGMSGRIFFLKSPLINATTLHTGPNTVDTPSNTINNTHPPLQKHDHLSFYFTDGSELRLNDTRRFGFVDLHPTKTLDTCTHFKTLGPEPLDQTAFTPDILHKSLQGRATEIKKVLMENKTVVGIGNIYASEALFKAKIHPQKHATKISKHKTHTLHNAIVTTLTAAIAAGGSSLKDYVHTDGSLGYFQNTFKVYGRAKAPCTTCNTPIQKITQAGRATYFCPTCQRR